MIIKVAGHPILASYCGRIKLVFTIPLVTMLNYCIAQGVFKINTTETYAHATGLQFPVKIKSFNRLTIDSFDKDGLNVGVTYVLENDTGKTTITVLVYPDDYAHENRLRKAYTEALDALKITTNSLAQPVETIYLFGKEKYKANGLQAEINDADKSAYHYLAVFECGQWMLKFRMTSNFQNTAALTGIQAELLELFNPPGLIKKYPQDGSLEIGINASLLKDVVISRAVALAAFTKLAWLQNRTNKFGKRAGVPGLYLEEHTGPLTVMVGVWENSSEKRESSTDEYMNELKTLIEKDFLDEFVMDQYNRLLIIPGERHLDFEAYERWQKEHPLKIDLHQPFYTIQYRH